jgi:group I intron endonuclease
MRIFKSHPLLKLVNSYVIDSPQPSNLSYLWNFGSLLTFCLIIQIVTGVTLAMHYNPSVLEAFNSVEHIMRDVNNGWLIRYLHSNTASAFFFLVYLHIGRGLYYGSYRAPRTLVWVLGIVIFLLMIITAFLGFLNIAQNGINSIQQKQLQQKQLQQQDNNITYDKPSEESQESFYLEELFGEKPYDKNKLGKSTITWGKRYYSTIYIPGKRYYSTDRDCSNTSKILKDFILEKNLEPVYIYENLGDNSTKKNILEDTKGLSGIYLILNKVTMDYYIGSASTNRINKRFSNHLIHLTGSKVLKNAVRKYKISEFAFLVLEIFPEIVTQENNKKLLDLEDFYLKSLLPNYNILTEAGSSFGYKHSELTRIKMITNYSQERRDRIGNLNKNRKFSATTISLMREKALNRIKPIYSEQALENMKKASKPIIVYNLDHTVHGKYTSILDASKNLNCSVKTIYRSLKSDNKLLKKRWIVDYIN